MILLLLDTEDSMNDHEDTNGSKESFREQDIYLPIANVARIMKNAIPQTGKVTPSQQGLNSLYGWGMESDTNTRS